MSPVATSESASDCFYVPGQARVPADVGGKARGLALLQALGEKVPAWVAIRALPPEQPLPRQELLALLARAGLHHKPLAIRSSALVEDGETRSYAGQFRTLLGVPPGDEAALWQAIETVRFSGRSTAALAYAAGAGEPGAPAVGVVLQELVPAAVSGVAFSADPVTGDRDVVVIAAAYGLGDALVGGEVDGDLYRVDGQGRIASEVRTKECARYLTRAGDLRAETVPEPGRSAPALTDAEVRMLTACARRLQHALGSPQDIEWALVDAEPGRRELLLLQTRPITALTALKLKQSPPPAGGRRVWDNSNIIESYHGVTTPLTFSFARAAYEQVYLQFCRVLGVEESLLQQHRDVFGNMLGLVRGRVYYNLLNWYRALSLLPGYSVNRAFMERMMGVREKLADPPAPPYTAGKARDALRLLRMSGRLVREYQRLPREIARFHRRVEETLGPFACRDLTECPVEDLLALYRRVERELLTRWRAPLVNDFFAMIAFGLLGRLVERWLPGSPATLINDLLSGEGGIISTEPARRLRTLAEQVRECPRLSRLFAGSDPAAVWRELRTNPEMHEFRSRIEAYLEQFGERCANELKLETVTLREDPTLLIELLKAYAERPLPEQAGAAVRRAAEDELAAQVRGMRRLILLLVLRETRKRVRDRENLRFERTRVFGLARRIFLALGAHLGQSRRLESERDIFYLTREEVFGAFEGTGVTADLTALVRLRRAEFEGYAQEPPPPDRFETFGTQDTTPASPEPGREERGQLSGTGCCPGIVRAPVRVVRDPAQAGDLRDCILVAERTDPGWTVLFPLARGLLVQRGSLLSHSAIVAREIGLPCIVGIAGLMGALRDGEWVEMDGTTGRLHRVEAGK